MRVKIVVSIFFVFVAVAGIFIIMNNYQKSSAGLVTREFCPKNIKLSFVGSLDQIIDQAKIYCEGFTKGLDYCNYVDGSQKMLERNLISFDCN